MILSIIVPVYNVENYVERCIRSCEQQDISTQDYEIICINDGSRDRSLQITQDLSKIFDNIIIITQPNRGLSAARNEGMRAAHGDYYMFVDSDDWIEANCLGYITQRLKTEAPDCMAICGANVFGEVVKKRKNFIDERPITGAQFLQEGAQHGAPFAIWNASFLKRNSLSFVEGIYHEDSEFTPRAYYLAQKVARSNEIIYYVYQNPNSITRTNNPKRAYDIIDVVCPSLYHFAEKVDNKYKSIFYDRIGVLFSTALDQICFADNRNSFIESVANNKEVIGGLLHSSKLKYKIEAVLIKFFPHVFLSFLTFLMTIKRK